MAFSVLDTIIVTFPKFRSTKREAQFWFVLKFRIIFHWKPHFPTVSLCRMAWRVPLLLSCNTGGCGPEALPGGGNTHACSCEFRVISWGHDLTLIPAELWGKDSQGPTSHTVPCCSCCLRAIQASRDRRNPHPWHCVLGSNDQKFTHVLLQPFSPLAILLRFQDVFDSWMLCHWWDFPETNIS